MLSFFDEKSGAVLFSKAELPRDSFPSVQGRRIDPSMSLMNNFQLVLVKTSIQIRYCFTFGQIDYHPDKSGKVAVK